MCSQCRSVRCEVAEEFIDAVRELEPSLGRFAFLTRWNSLHLPFRSCTGPFISPDSNHSSRNSTSKKPVSLCIRTIMADAFVFTPETRRRYTGSSATADSADCRFGDMAREREGGEEGGREGGKEGRREGRGGEGRGLSTLSTNQNLCDRGA